MRISYPILSASDYVEYADIYTAIYQGRVLGRHCIDGAQTSITVYEILAAVRTATQGESTS